MHTLRGWSVFCPFRNCNDIINGRGAAEGLKLQAWSFCSQFRICSIPYVWNRFGSITFLIYKMPSAQDPFYVVKEEIQESVSFFSFFPFNFKFSLNYQGFVFCLIWIRHFNSSRIIMLRTWLNDCYWFYFLI